MTSSQPRKCLALLLSTALLAGGCAGAGGLGDPDDPNSINVLMVNNPQMLDIQRLTAEHFTKKSGVKVNFTVLPENDVRDKISQDFTSQAGQYDIATLSNYEVPIYAKNKWLASLDEFVAADPGFDQQDVLEPIRKSLTAADGKVYAQPFYGESSFLMYRKDILAAKGLTMPERPTWQQVAEIAAAVDGSQKDLKGICLRGQPGWGQLMAPLTTVVNTFGGTWFTQDWQAKLASPEFTEATRFYVDLVREHGEAGAPQAGFAECLNNMTQGKTAMWYDATSAAGLLEAEDSPVRGKLGFAQAPVVKTQSSGWLYTWAFAMQQASAKKQAAWKFMSWASGKDYETVAGQQLGWSKVPDGKRTSTYQRPEYLKLGGSYADATRQAIATANPDNPGVQPRPAYGIQFVGIPEFTNLGTQVSQEISSAIAGRQSVDEALAAAQGLADKVAAKYRKS
ncbi:sorbitol/mannitol transport system substrate-binding protein [Crossiella equi]|uniref:Sorbitol/mannitol transport system substrate-binding protein n=1 Tax=Crossiella equi TaxID=130796 RepID=A0ABS5A759_9PSEU|nr:sugar ABC transporter substrate-binding protein [Crossiella equi]MBP2472059.1 sorbitol/mannitol transport system substrate-binding protein [Crossiella equi]